MIRAFWQSRLALYLSAGVAVALSLAIWIYDRGKPLYIPLLATVLLVALCLLIGQVAGKVIAESLNARYLSLLHIELDPQAFLAAYEKIPERLKKNSQEYALSRAYLADGYAAAGEFLLAIDTLFPHFIEKKGENQALKGLYFSSLASYAISAEKIEQAKEALLKLEQVAADNKKGNPKLSKNMKESLTLSQNRLTALKGKSADVPWLKEQLKKCPFALRRLEILQTLIRQAILKDQKADAEKWLQELEKQAGKTFYREWGEKIKKDIFPVSS